MSMSTRRDATHFLTVSGFACVTALSPGCATAKAETKRPSIPEQCREVDTRSIRDVIRTPTDDAVELIDQAIARYNKSIRGYRCTLTRQERLRGRLTSVQTIDVTYRESPKSVRLVWTGKPGKVDRVVYVAGRDRNRKGEPCALVRPASALVRLVASEVSVPVHGRKARQASRHTIDEFGFGELLTRIRKLNCQAEHRGDLDLTMLADGQIDGRPTKVIRRRLPPGRDYPDGLLIMHLDAQTLLPAHVETYADRDGRHLLGRYTFTNVRMNPPIRSSDFDL